MNIKLTGVARGSFGELLEDYKDFLRTRKLEIWDKDDVRLAEIRKMRISNESDKANLSNWTNDSEKFANLLLTLISKENFLLDRMIASLEKKFIEEGGYSENLTRKRINFRNSN